MAWSKFVVGCVISGESIARFRGALLSHLPEELWSSGKLLLSYFALVHVGSHLEGSGQSFQTKRTNLCDLVFGDQLNDQFMACQ